MKNLIKKRDRDQKQGNEKITIRKEEQINKN
jgi:hypothetical protein